MGKHVNLNNILCKDCKHKNCICYSDEELQQIYRDIKPSPAKDIIGRSLELMSALRVIANRQGYFVKKEPEHAH